LTWKQILTQRRNNLFLFPPLCEALAMPPMVDANGLLEWSHYTIRWDYWLFLGYHHVTQLHGLMNRPLGQVQGNLCVSKSEARSPICPCGDFGFGTTWSHGNSKWKCSISYWLSYMITLWMLKACKTGSSCGGSWRFCTLHKPSFATRDEFGPVQFCHKTRGPQLPNRNKWMSP
jgi:hypothetical protein